MKSDIWNKIDEIVFKALQLDPLERQKFIKQECAESPDLLSEVESLLANENEVDEYFEAPALFKYADFLEGESSHDDSGAYNNRTIGNYQTIREIGYGGMGTVYLAQRSDGKFEQKVAIKLLKRELNTSALRRRFRHEREILASLEHPNIARLIDAGATDDEIPYIVMEYIEGEPIDEYCSREGLSLSRRLDLFRIVCNAIDFAHRNLVVHRDVKPSNILVTKDGVPKLLDFGIAKIVSEDLSDQATLTQFGAMTPSYASPEQLQRKSVTTSTDVYSLGVVLYELLSGHRPFEKAEIDLKHIYDAVCETDPLPPSAAADPPSQSKSIPVNLETLTRDDSTDKESETAKEKPPTTEAIRSHNTASPKNNISPQYLRGDLDNIVLKALQKEPSRRYSSAENFAEDIRRHQAGLPVNARPDTFSYRAGKFIRRNRFAAASASLLILALIGGFLATLWQARIAQAEKTKAEKRFNDVRTLANSLLFEITPEIEKLTGSTRAKEFLVKRALEYLDSLSSEAVDDKELRKELAAAYQKVGDVQGNPYKDNIGDLGGGLKSYEKSKAIFEKLLLESPDDDGLKKDLSKTYGLIGDVHFYQEESKKAEEIFTKAIELNKQIIEKNPEDYETHYTQGMLYNSLGLIPFWAGKNKEALEIYDRSLKIFESLNRKKPDNISYQAEIANTNVRIGEVWLWEDQTQKGIGFIQKGLDLIKEISDENPADKKYKRTLMLAYMMLADGYAAIESWDKCLALYRQSLDIAQQAETEDKANKRAKRDYITIKFKFSETLDMAGKNIEGLKNLEDVLKVRKELAESDPTNPTLKHDIATTNNAIGESLFNLKRYDSALSAFLVSLKEFENVTKIAGADEGRVARGLAFAHINVGKTYSKMAVSGPANRKKALSYYQSGTDMLEKQDAEGALTEYDKKELAEVKTAIKKLKEMSNQASH